MLYIFVLDCAIFSGLHSPRVPKKTWTITKYISGSQKRFSRYISTSFTIVQATHMTKKYQKAEKLTFWKCHTIL